MRQRKLNIVSDLAKLTMRTSLYLSARFEMNSSINMFHKNCIKYYYKQLNRIRVKRPGYLMQETAATHRNQHFDATNGVTWYTNQLHKATLTACFSKFTTHLYYEYHHLIVVYKVQTAGTDLLWSWLQT